jgi:Cof subfamily protein (haloacid dehalogenase superfamily)
MYKAIFIDIDGTLRDNNKNISDRTVNVIKSITDKGIQVVLCSGRQQKYIENISRYCNASKFVISSTGGSIYDYENDQLMYANSMDKDAVISLYKIAQNADVRFLMNAPDNIVTTKVKYNDGLEKLLEEPIETFVNNNSVFQCTVGDNEYLKIKKIIPSIEQVVNCEIKAMHRSLKDDSAPKTGYIYCDVSNETTSKGKAVRKFCEIFGIKKEETIAIGDDSNDVSMFKEVGLSVAMGNANDKIKEIADVVTLSNEEDGVAIFLEKLFTEI